MLALVLLLCLLTGIAMQRTSSVPEVVTYQIGAVGIYSTGDMMQPKDGLRVTINEEDSLVMVCDDADTDEVFRIDSVTYVSGKYNIKMIHTHHQSSRKAVYMDYKFTFATDKEPEKRDFLIMLINDVAETLLIIKKEYAEPIKKS